MEPTAFITQMRDHYIEQFRAFADKKRKSCTKGAAEVKLRLSEESELFQRLYCADFIQSEEQNNIVELVPESVLSFEPISGTLGAATLLIEHLRWDDVLIYHNLPAPPLDQLQNWFVRWFDPDDLRYDDCLEFSSIIHSLLVKQGSLSIDFGTAPVQAFWEILDILEIAGATNIRVSISRAK